MPGAKLCPTAKFTPLLVYWIDVRVVTPIAFATFARVARPSWAKPTSGESSTTTAIKPSILRTLGLLASGMCGRMLTAPPTGVKRGIRNAAAESALPAASAYATVTASEGAARMAGNTPQ